MQSPRNKLTPPKNVKELTSLNIAEYQSLRSECLATIQNRFNLFIAGVAGVGASIGGALAVSQGNKTGSSVFVYIILSWIIPIFSSIIATAWLSEAVRCHRAGFYVAKRIEFSKANLESDLPVHWDTALWNKEMIRDEKFGPSSIILIIFIGFSITSIFVSDFLMGVSPFNKLNFEDPFVFLFVVFSISPKLYWSVILSYFYAHLPVLENIEINENTNYPTPNLYFSNLLKYFCSFFVSIYISGTIISSLQFIY